MAPLVLAHLIAIRRIPEYQDFTIVPVIESNWPSVANTVYRIFLANPALGPFEERFYKSGGKIYPGPVTTMITKNDGLVMMQAYMNMNRMRLAPHPIITIGVHAFRVRVPKTTEEEILAIAIDQYKRIRRDTHDARKISGKDNTGGKDDLFMAGNINMVGYVRHKQEHPHQYF